MRKEKIKLTFFTRLLLRFSRLKLKQAKDNLRAQLGDNFPVFGTQGKNPYLALE